MDANTFRNLFEYHFTRNRELWQHCIATLTPDQFVQEIDYSIGSLRNQCVHLQNIDERWFSGLRGLDLPDFADPAAYPDAASVRAKWDAVEAGMREYLADLKDSALAEDFMPGVKVWQILFHVINHGTDHRAQMLASLHALGAPTFAQDYFFFANDMPVKVTTTT
ncbi:MAG TPA: DinB family protein [Anaerolineales bacterium]|nr:DinB family protein [Anaerolineales bacterium]HRQ91637.1 DinB family protein [Anaerolineales bacterium]